MKCSKIVDVPAATLGLDEKGTRAMKLDSLLRVGYSFLGLMAGDGVLLILILMNALRISCCCTGTSTLNA